MAQIFKNKKFQRTTLILSVVVLTIISGTMGFDIYQTNTIQAESSTKELSGYAWSSNIGWISMNCSNTENCGTSNYKVTLNEDGSLTGYAWSSNIGWLQFGGLSRLPQGNGTQSVNARINTTTGNMEGWARFLSYGNDVLNNTTKLAWDGFVSLSGRSVDGSTYGPKRSGNTLLGYAWGDDVVGWIDFSSVSLPEEKVTLYVNISGGKVGDKVLVHEKDDCSDLSNPCQYEFNLNDEVNLTAESGDVSVFDSWDIDNDISCDEYVCKFNIEQDTTATANFIEEKVTLTINIRGGGSGTVSLNYGEQETFPPDGSIEVSKNEEITLNASAGEGSEFSIWELSLDKDTCEQDNETGPVCIINTGDSGGTVTAWFNVVSDDDGDSNGDTTTRLRIRDIRWEEF